MAALTRLSLAAMTMTCPPPKELPKMPTFSGSTKSSERMYESAEVQSASWAGMESSCRGSPSDSPK